MTYHLTRIYSSRHHLLVLGAAVMLLAVAAPAHAQRCFTQNGVTVCCDANGNCQTR